MANPIGLPGIQPDRRLQPLFPLKDNVARARLPILTLALIALNVAIFGYQLTLSNDPRDSPRELREVGVSERDELAINFGAIPARITEPGRECAVALLDRGLPRGVRSEIVCEGAPHPAGRLVAAADLDAPPWWVTVLSSMFLHAGLLHLAGNMLFLWVFGPAIEGSMGRGRFLGFYVAAGIVAVYAQALLDLDATGPTVGASGAVAGVLGGYLLLYWHARVLTLVFVPPFVTLIQVPAMALLGIWFALQFLPAVGQLATPEVAGEAGIAYLAHVGGFLFGLAVVKLLADRRRVSEPEPPYPVY